MPFETHTPQGDHPHKTYALGAEEQVTGKERVQPREVQSQLRILQPVTTDKPKLSINLEDKRINKLQNQVKGSLKSKFSFWKEIGANKFVLDTIQNGYSLPFDKLPHSNYLENNKSALQNDSFVKEAITDLLQSGSVIEVDHKPFVVNPLTVAQNSVKKRLVLDLRYVNPFLWKEHVRFEDWKFALDYYHENCYMYNFDLKSGYHHIDINENHYKYLGFAWKFGDKNRYFVFTVLPFGLATAGHIFTKVLREIVAHWRSMSIKIIMYLDDGIGFEKNYEIALKHSKIIKSDLKKAGLISNDPKSTWEPVQELIWLGVGLNSSESKLFIPQDKIQKIKGLIEFAIKKKYLTARQLASVVGKINSTYIVVGGIARLMLKHCHRLILSRQSWDGYVRLSEEVLTELNFWYLNLNTCNSRSLNTSSKYNKVVFSDASATGCGSFIVDVEGAVCSRSWRQHEKIKSSTWRELKGVSCALKCFRPMLANNVIKWYSDNQSVISIVQHGSMKLELHNLALEIYSFCNENNIQIQIDWVPRGENKTSDAISRYIDYDDWEINSCLFTDLQNRFGTFTVDLFADYSNAKVDKFYSKFWEENCSGVDALAYNWANEFCWTVPPVSLVSKVINKILQDKAKGVLIVPRWRSSLFWPLLVEDDYAYKSFVKNAVIYDDCSFILKEGINCKFFSEQYGGQMLMILYDASW